MQTRNSRINRYKHSQGRNTLMHLHTSTISTMNILNREPAPGLLRTNKILGEYTLENRIHNSANAVFDLRRARLLRGRQPPAMWDRF